MTGVLRVLDGERRQPGRVRAVDPCPVGAGQIAEERPQRPPVSGDVVDQHQQRVLVRPFPGGEQGCAYGEFGTQIEAVAGLPLDLPVHRVPGGPQLPERRPCGRPAQYPAYGGAVALLEDGAEHFVTFGDPGQRLVQRGHVDRAPQPDQHRQVVRGAYPDPVQEPQPVLRVRHRERPRGVTGRGGRCGARRGSGVDERGEQRRGGRLEEPADVDLGAEHGTDPAQQPGGEQGVAAEGEEVVVGADPVRVQHLGEQLAQGGHGAAHRRPASEGRRGSGLRKGGPVQLSMRR